MRKNQVQRNLRILLCVLVAWGWATAGGATVAAESDAGSSTTAGQRAGVRLSDTYLGRVAAQLKPGEFAVLESAIPPSYSRFGDLLRVRVDDGRRLETDGWTDSAHWDPKRLRTFFLGERQYKKFISYDAATNAWQELGWQGDPPPRFEQFGHTYGRTALDWRRGHYYRLTPGGLLHRYVIDEARWEVFRGAPVGGYISMEWHYGIDMLVAVAGGKAFGFRDGRWVNLGRSSVDGYHSVAQYNAVRHDMLAAGGNKSRRKVDLIDSEGVIHAKRDAPFDISIARCSLTYDPMSGNYLLLRRDQRELYEYNPDSDEWRLAVDWSKSGWPFERYGFEVPIEIDQLGVILWQYAKGPKLYRHKSVFAATESKRARWDAPSEVEPTQPATAEQRPATMEPQRATMERAATTEPQPAATKPQPVRSGQRTVLVGERGAGAARPAVEPSLPPASVIVFPPVSSVAEAVPAESSAKSAEPAESAKPAKSTSDSSSAASAGPRAGRSDAAPPAKLAEILRSMRPGEWRHIPTTLPADRSTLFQTLFVEFCPLGGNRGTYGNGWMDSFAYDPATRSYFALLMRDQSEKRVVWLDRELHWGYARNPPGIDTCAFNRRTFNRVTVVDGWLYWLPAYWGAQRVKVGTFMRTRVEDFLKTGTGVFEEYGVGVGITSIGQAGDYAVAWFPEMGAWILHLPGNDTPDPVGRMTRTGAAGREAMEDSTFRGRVYMYRPGDARWTYLDRTYSQGFASRVLYNAVRGEVLIGPGGYGPTDAFTRVTANGKVIRLRPAVTDTGEKMHYRTSNNNLTFDPVSGDYLQWSYDAKRIWRSADGETWRTYEDFDGLKFNGSGGLFGASAMIQVNPIPGTDGLIWFDPHRGVILHRMRE